MVNIFLIFDSIYLQVCVQVLAENGTWHESICIKFKIYINLFLLLV